MQRRVHFLAVAGLLAWTACSEPAAPAAAPRAVPVAEASEGAMCPEHHVLEAVCTKCKPALAAVFKAKGDWCDAHGFPESFCPLCHPDRGGRPEADVSASDDGPPDGTKVRFATKETARLAGLRFATAIERDVRSEVVATARVDYDATRVAQINPRMPGVVHAVLADVGTRVRVGAPLASIESAGVGAEQARLQAARARLEVAEANHARVRALHAERVTPEKELLAAGREREEARADVRAARAALGMVGAMADGGARYTLTSPISGVVTERRATIGRLVDQEAILFEVVDPAKMWIELDIPESALPLVSVGQQVDVTLEGLPTRTFSGALFYVSPSVDRRTRTASARLAIENLDGALRANLFGQGRIAVTEAHPAVMVPREAVQRARNVMLVFVRLAVDLYEARRVTVGPSDGDLVSVTGRIAAGEQIVTEGSFLLKTETLKESIGAGCCEVQ